MATNTVTLTRNEAMTISAYLDALKRLGESHLINEKEIKKMEELLDSQIWGVNNHA
jgi:hypothetical protein